MTQVLRPVVDVTVCIPSIPPRQVQLQRALRSVYDQTVVPAAINIHVDEERRGAAVNRDASVGETSTEWLAFLDDDDELLPQHLELLLREARRTDADLVYPWFTVAGGTDPFPTLEGQPWDDSEPHQVPITFLVRRDAYEEVGGFAGDWDTTLAEDPGTDEAGNRAGEDYHFILKLVRAGRRIVHLNERTWIWNHWHGNTSGLPTRW